MLGPFAFGGSRGRCLGGMRLLGVGSASNEVSARFLKEPSAAGVDARARLLCKNAFWLCPMIRR
jgi:hypothetical protein